jgi:tripartite-type tricarboxylate transporter receptor subunit TctC
MLSRRRLIKLSAASVFAPTIISSGALAQAWPTRHLRIVIPFPPGGGADIIARLIAFKMSETLGQQVIVESKSGAGGNVASEHVARSDPDGYTMFLAGDHLATSHFINPKVTFDPVRDFEPISLIVKYPIIMAVPTNSPDKTLADFIARARKDPGKLTYGSPGAGAVPHLSGELLVHHAKLKMVNVQYRGAAPGIQDLIPGRIDSFWNNIAPLLPLAKDNQLRMLAVTTAQRSPLAPEVRSISEDVPSYGDVSGWYALFVPGKTPKEIIAKLSSAAAAATNDPPTKKKLEDQAMIAVGSTSEELRAFHKADMEKWGHLIEQAGLQQKS